MSTSTAPLLFKINYHYEVPEQLLLKFLSAVFDQSHGAGQGQGGANFRENFKNPDVDPKIGSAAVSRHSTHGLKKCVRSVNYF